MNRSALAALAGSLGVLIALWWGHQQVRTDLPETVHAAIADNQLVVLKGTVTSAHRNPEGMWRLVMQPTGRTVLLMPNLGVLPLLPRVGDQLQITARRVETRFGPTFYPVSQDLVQRIGRVTLPVISIAQARNRPKDDTIRLRVQGTRAAVMKSKAGKRHLHISVRDASGEAPGIMWEGSYRDREVDLFQSGRSLVIDAKVDVFQGQLSLVILSVEED